MLKKIFLILLLAISFNYYYLPGYSNELSSPKSIDLILEAENTTNNSKTEELKYYLPEEIIPEYIEENNGFSIELDISKGRYYLKKSINFAPGEILRFNFKVKNIWTISSKELSSYLEEAKILCDTLVNKSVADKAEVLYKSIEQRYNEIVVTQEKEESAKSVEAHIEQFRINEKKLEEIIRTIDKLRNLQPFKKIGDVDLKIPKGKIWTIILMVVSFICIISFLTWKMCGKTD